MENHRDIKSGTVIISGFSYRQHNISTTRVGRQHKNVGIVLDICLAKLFAATKKRNAVKVITAAPKDE
jgi:hypothetical protein